MRTNLEKKSHKSAKPPCRGVPHPVTLHVFFIFVVFFCTPISLVFSGENFKSNSPFSFRELPPALRGLGPATGTSIRISPRSANVGFGESISFTNSGGQSPMVWSVSSQTYGSIDSSSGVFTAKMVETGSYNFYVVVTDGRGRVARANVTIVRNTIELLPSIAAVETGESLTFVATSGYTGRYTWTTSNANLGSISASTGVFTAGTSAGTVVVTVTDYAGSTETATVRIVGTVLNVAPAVLTITKGDSITFTGTGGTGTYFWSSSNINLGVIVFDTGEFTARSRTTAEEGSTVTVTATDSSGNSGTAVVTIVGTSIAVTPYTVDVAKAGTQQFATTGASGTVYWSSSDRSIGTIDSTGLFTASTVEGSTTITARDSLENTGTATATVISTYLAIIPAVWSVSNVATGSDLTNSFSASGGSGTYFWSISNNDSTSAYTDPTLSATTGTSIDVTVAIPTSVLGDQVLTILVQDTYGDSGTATVTVEAAD